MEEFAHWDSFCLIVGSAAGALIGLQFVVLTLIAERPPSRIAETGPVFSSPTIVHFGAVLLATVLIRMPWHEVTSAAIALGLLGLAGLVYVAVVIRVMHNQSVYKPDREDTAFHCVTPLVGYGLIAVSALAAPSHTHDALFGIAAGSLTLLYTAIHNAWDSIVFQVMVYRVRETRE